MSAGRRRLLEIAAVVALLLGSLALGATPGQAISYAIVAAIALVLVELSVAARGAAAKPPARTPQPAEADHEAATNKIVGFGFLLAVAAIIMPIIALAAAPLGVIAVVRDRVGAGVVILLIALVGGALSAAYSVGAL